MENVVQVVITTIKQAQTSSALNLKVMPDHKVYTIENKLFNRTTRNTENFFVNFEHSSLGAFVVCIFDRMGNRLAGRSILHIDDTHKSH